MRQTWSVTVTACLLLAFLWTPLLHVHRDVAHVRGDHSDSLIHGHFPPAHSAGHDNHHDYLSEAHGKAKPLDTFVFLSTGSTAATLAVLTPVQLPLPVFAQVGWIVLRHSAQMRAPPLLDHTPSRAPPA